MSKKILILPGDGIGPEITQAAVDVLQVLNNKFGLKVETETALVGGSAYDDCGQPLPETTLNLAKEADAVLLGAVGGPKWEPLDIAVRPEKALLGLREELSLFANLRPAILYNYLANASSLKYDRISGLDLLIIRELTGGIYFGKPRGVEMRNNERVGFNTYIYAESEIKRIAHVAFQSAQKRQKRLCSVDKANVLEVTELWRNIFNEISSQYPDVELTHMYVDNAAMQLVRAPKQFDVMVTGNMFGDILSDCAAMLTGSIGMLPSASLDANNKGMFEPIHGSAPDIAGNNQANPIATVLSLAMLLRYSLGEETLAVKIEEAIDAVLANGYRTADIALADEKSVGTTEMSQAIVSELLKV
ncbi:MAG: 3-isopropylmalate dehydrogenase [Pseudomonadota bacterium]